LRQRSAFGVGADGDDLVAVEVIDLPGPSVVVIRATWPSGTVVKAPAPES